MSTPIITIDGPAASGKSSVSCELAKRFGWNWVSTGAFYRGLSFVAYKTNANIEDEQALVKLIKEADWEVKMTLRKTEFYYNGNNCTKDIFQEEVGSVASKMSHYPEVRKQLLQAQRNMAKGNNGLIAEGRDCGTVVFPQAEVKIYLTANSESRALRRAIEEGADIQATIEAQKIRDHQDKNRKAAPLQMAKGAHLVDTSQLDLNQVVDHVEKIIKSDLNINTIPIK